MSIESTIDKIKNRYNGDNDMIPNGPLVTWAEYELADAIERLLLRLQIAENEILLLKHIMGQP